MFLKIPMLDTKHIPQYVLKFPCNRSLIKATLLKGPDTVHSPWQLEFPYSTFTDKSGDSPRLVSN